MTGWEVDPGSGRSRKARRLRDNGPLANTSTRTETFERSRSVDVTFAPRTTTVIEMKLKQKGVPYWSRFDLGIDPEDVKISGRKMTITVHSLGAIDAPPAKLVVRDASGHVMATAMTPALKAPTDLIPKTALVTLQLPAAGRPSGWDRQHRIQRRSARDHADEQHCKAASDLSSRAARNRSGETLI